MYNGHKNYNAWNISLWLFNTEYLYNMVKWAVKTSKNRNDAAKKLMLHLPEATPDGVKYTKTNIKLALVGA